jgi:hypothetical protein
MISGRHKIAVVAAIALSAVLTGSGEKARAQVYGFSTIQTSSYTFTGATASLSTTSSSDSAIVNGSGVVITTGLPDVPEAFQGPEGKPLENTFSAKGQTSPDYARGDALIATPLASLATNAVAEAYLTSVGGASSAASMSVNVLFTVGTAGAVTIGFSYLDALDLNNMDASGGVVVASDSYNIVIKNNDHITVFTSSPKTLNHNPSQDSMGETLLQQAGTTSITTGVLPAGTYTATITTGSTVDLRQGVASTVPEPGSLAMLGGIALTGAAGILRRRRA